MTRPNSNKSLVSQGRPSVISLRKKSFGCLLQGIAMFKRPRGNKDAEVLASQKMTKRLKKEDCEESLLERRRVHQEDYVNVTYPQRKTGSTIKPSVSTLSELTERAETPSQDKAKLLHYNRLKLQHKRGNCTHEVKMINCNYVSMCDSDSSSIASEMTDTHSEADPLESGEKEHYNKLKVDIHKIPTNKKLLRGVRVLHAQSDKQSLFSGAIASSALLQSRKLTQRCAKVGSISDQVPHVPLKYKKEGHTNRLHSVVKPRVFTSLLKPTQLSLPLHKSKSTGDLLEDAGYEHTSVHPLVHSKSIHNLESESGRHHTSSPTPFRHTDHSQRPNSCSSPKLAFMNKIITFPCTHDGMEINSAAFNFSVSIPKGAVRKRKSAEFQVGVCMHGPFFFPKGYKLVSPIIMVTSPTENKLKKPIDVTIPHCIDLTKAGEDENLMFFRAKSTDSSLTHSNKYYFQPTESASSHFQLHSNYSKLASVELGFFCIMTKDTVETRKHTNYCLVPVVPKNVESPSWKVHYCLTYFLQASIMVSTIQRVQLY